MKNSIINKPTKAPPKFPKAVPNTPDSGKPVLQEAFDQAMDLIESKLNISNYLIIGVIVALTICFISVFYGYWQFVWTVNNSYTQTVKEFNDEKYKILLNRIENIEKNSIETQLPTIVPKNVTP